MRIDKNKIQRSGEFETTIDLLYLLHNQIEQEKRGKSANGFSPSFISRSTCERAWFWHYIRKEREEFVWPKLARVFSLGHAIHDRIQKLLILSGVSSDDKIEVRLESEEWGIRGYVDGIIIDRDNSLVLEIKSINDKGFIKVEKDGPKRDHVIQANLYMWLLDLDKAVIYYENKNDSRHIAYTCQRDDGIIVWLKSMIKKVRTYHALNLVPSIAYNQYDFECKYCPWQASCQNIGGDKKKGADQNKMTKVKQSGRISITSP